MGDMTRDELKAVLSEMDEALASRDLAKLRAYARTRIESWNGGTPTGNVKAAIYRACVEAGKGVWDHPLKNAAWRAWEREFPDESEPTTGSREG
jgi:hypothetical protein